MVAQGHQVEEIEEEEEILEVSLYKLLQLEGNIPLTLTNPQKY